MYLKASWGKKWEEHFEAGDKPQPILAIIYIHRLCVILSGVGLLVHVTAVVRSYICSYLSASHNAMCIIIILIVVMEFIHVDLSR